MDKGRASYTQKLLGKMKKCVDITNVLNYNKGIVRNKRTVITRINP